MYPRAESGGGGAHWLLRSHGGIICIYSLGRGKGRLGVILAWRHSHLSQYRTHISFQLLNTFLPPCSSPSPLPITRTWDPASAVGKLSLATGIGHWGKPQQRDKASTCQRWEFGKEAGKQCQNTGGTEFQSCFFNGTGAGREVKGLNLRCKSPGAGQHSVRAGKQESLLPWKASPGSCTWVNDPAHVQS